MSSLRDSSMVSESFGCQAAVCALLEAGGSSFLFERRNQRQDLFARLDFETQLPRGLLHRLDGRVALAHGRLVGEDHLESDSEL